MHWPTVDPGALALLGLAASQAMAACPYADQLAARSETFGETSNSYPQLPDTNARGRRAEGKKGVFFM